VTRIAARTLITTCAALLTLFATVIGASNPGETSEQKQDVLCESAVWPMIPATCFGRQPSRVVYQGTSAVKADEPIAVAHEIRKPSSVATSGKSDRLGPFNIMSAEYRTVETRTNRNSILTRIRIAD